MTLSERVARLEQAMSRLEVTVADVLGALQALRDVLAAKRERSRAAKRDVTPKLPRRK